MRFNTRGSSITRGRGNIVGKGVGVAAGVSVGDSVGKDVGAASRAEVAVGCDPEQADARTTTGAVRVSHWSALDIGQ